MCRYLASRRPCVAVGVVTGSFSSVRRDRLVVTAYGSAGGSDPPPPGDCRYARLSLVKTQT